MSALLFLGLALLPISVHGDETVDSTYSLGTDDEVRMTVFGEPELSGTYTLDDTGAIAVPLIGEVKLEGLNLHAAERLVTAQLADGYLIEPSVSLEMIAYRPFFILGEVRKPGSYNYAEGMTALKAVALAGGFTYRAKESRVTLKRSNGIEETHPPETKISPGDVVIIEERFF